MNRISLTLGGLGFAAGLGILGPTASAADVDISLGLPGPSRTVVVQQPPTVVKHWVPDQIVRKEERVVVEPGRIVKREEQVLVEPGRAVRREEQVLVEPAHVERRKEQRIIRESFVEKRWVPGVDSASIRVGPVQINGGVSDGHWVEVRVPAQVEVVVREVTVPARYGTVVKDVQIPPRYETVVKDVPVGQRYQIVKRDVLVPGHWEESVVAAPPVVVERPSGIGVDLDLDVFHRHRHD